MRSNNKKWLDIEVDASRCVAARWQSKGAAGGAQGTVKCTPLDQCLASIIGSCLVSGVVPQREIHTDLAMDKAAVGELLVSYAQRAFKLHTLQWHLVKHTWMFLQGMQLECYVMK